MSKFGSLASRVAVAVPGIGLFILIALLDYDPLTAGSFAILASLSSVESVRLMGEGRGGPALYIPATLLTGCAALAVALTDPRIYVVIIFAPGAFLSLIWLLREGIDGSRRRTGGFTCLTAAAALAFGLLARLRLDFPSAWVLFIPLLICWSGDSLAYFAGSAFGRHKMVPGISPGKSWEGLAAGLAGSVAGALVAGSLGAGMPLLPMVLLGLAGGVAAVAGDLLESSMKRDAGVKDSGSLLAGHGGLLDRFDSLLAVAPVTWLALAVMTDWGLL